jgi:hypothetical protein
MKKKRYSAPTATRARVALDEGFAGVSQRLSPSVAGQKAEWAANDIVGDDSGEAGTYYAVW